MEDYLAEWSRGIGNLEINTTQIAQTESMGIGKKEARIRYGQSAVTRAQTHFELAS